MKKIKQQSFKTQVGLFLNKFKTQLYVAAGITFGLILGFFIFGQQTQPGYSVVWAHNNSFKIPTGLYSFLLENGEDDCTDYAGTGTGKGTTLTTVHEVVDGRYAWIDIGCESISNQTADFPVVYHDGNWRIISAARYHVWDDDGNSYPDCGVVDEFEISKQFAPQCLEVKPSNDPEYGNTYEPVRVRDVEYN